MDCDGREGDARAVERGACGRDAVGVDRPPARVGHDEARAVEGGARSFVVHTGGDGDGGSVEDGARRVDADGLDGGVSETGGGGVVLPGDEPVGAVPCDGGCGIGARGGVDGDAGGVEHGAGGGDAGAVDVEIIELGVARVRPGDEERAPAEGGARVLLPAGDGRDGERRGDGREGRIPEADHHGGPGEAGLGVPGDEVDAPAEGDRHVVGRPRGARVDVERLPAAPVERRAGRRDAGGVDVAGVGGHDEVVRAIEGDGGPAAVVGILGRERGCRRGPGARPRRSRARPRSRCCSRRCSEHRSRRRGSSCRRTRSRERSGCHRRRQWRAGRRRSAER